MHEMVKAEHATFPGELVNVREVDKLYEMFGGSIKWRRLESEHFDLKQAGLTFGEIAEEIMATIHE